MASGMDDLSNATPNRVFTSFCQEQGFSLSLLLQLRLFCIVLIVRVVGRVFLLAAHGIPWTMMMTL